MCCFVCFYLLLFSFFFVCLFVCLFVLFCFWLFAVVSFFVSFFEGAVFWFWFFLGSPWSLTHSRLPVWDRPTNPRVCSQCSSAPCTRKHGHSTGPKGPHYQFADTFWGFKEDLAQTTSFIKTTKLDVWWQFWDAEEEDVPRARFVPMRLICSWWWACDTLTVSTVRTLPVATVKSWRFESLGKFPFAWLQLRSS